jgi:hypothetical protein
MQGEKPLRDALDKMRDLRKVSMTSSCGSPSGTSSTGDSPATEIPAPRLADYLKNPATLLQIPADPLLISALDFLKAVTSYEYDAPLYEHWYKEPGKIEFEQPLEKFPTAADIRKVAPEKQKAWKSLVEDSRLWMNGKPNGETYAKALPKL